MDVINIKTFQRVEFIDITSEIEKIIINSGTDSGIVSLFVPHTTAALTLNENADPSVKNDIKYKLNSLIPKNDNYTHSEGNSDSHLKSSIFGPSLTLIISGRSLVLGTWQGVYFCEFDGPRNRKLYVKIIKDNDSV
ncbi:MAG TPA: hypothetical protein DCY00_05920 [Actinobacteria bacterium]|nr:hypothetical protein [Actinomycetota bacterium]